MNKNYHIKFLYLFRFDEVFTYIFTLFDEYESKYMVYATNSIIYVAMYMLVYFNDFSKNVKPFLLIQHDVYRQLSFSDLKYLHL